MLLAFGIPVFGLKGFNVSHRWRVISSRERVQLRVPCLLMLQNKIPLVSHVCIMPRGRWVSWVGLLPGGVIV